VVVRSGDHLPARPHREHQGERGTGRGVRQDGRPLAGKTGTTNDNIAVWFAGYTPNLAAAAAVADLDPPQTSLNRRTYNGRYVPQAFGGNLPGPIWRTAMDAALDGQPRETFNRPSSKVKGLSRKASSSSDDEDD
jgi:membrane carboxypeptidase/penicillin-binding protein